MASLTLTVEDAPGGVRIYVKSDVDTETAPLTNAMTLMALVLDYLSSVSSVVSEGDLVKERVH